MDFTGVQFINDVHFQDSELFLHFHSCESDVRSVHMLYLRVQQPASDGLLLLCKLVTQCICVGEVS